MARTSTAVLEVEMALEAGMLLHEHGVAIAASFFLRQQRTYLLRMYVIMMVIVSRQRNYENGMWLI